MPPSPVALAVVVDEPAAPFAARRRILAARDQARVLDRDHRLVVVAVERPGLDLALGAFAAVQQLVERMQAVIAPRADVAQRGFQLLAASVSVHSTISIPSSATSQPAASTCARSGEPSTRIGLVLLMWIEDAPRRASPSSAASEPSGAVDRHVAHAPAGLVAGAGRDHLVVAKQRAVEQHDIGAVEPLASAPASRRRRPARRASRAVAAGDLDADIGAGLRWRASGSSPSR